MNAAAVEVWTIPLDGSLRLDGPLQEHLNAAEQALAARMRPGPGRDAFVTTRVALRQILAGYLACTPLDIRLAQREAGKPVLAMPASTIDLHFNVTHTRGLALCAVTQQREVSIDAEWMDPAVAWQGIARTVFSHREQADLAALPESDRRPGFFAGWARKEALLKGLGTGFSASTQAFDAPMLPSGLAANVCAAPDGSLWTLMDLAVGPDHAAALALQGSAPLRIVSRRFSAFLPTRSLA